MKKWNFIFYEKYLSSSGNTFTLYNQSTLLGFQSEAELSFPYTLEFTYQSLEWD